MLLLNPSIPLLSPPSLLAFTIYSSLHHLFKAMAMHKALVICLATLLFCSVFLIEAANSEAIPDAEAPPCNDPQCLTPATPPCRNILMCRVPVPPAEGKK